MGRWGEEKFSITPIGNDILFPVCSPKFAARLPEPTTPFDIACQPLLHFVETGRSWPDWQTFLATFRLKEPPPIEGLTFSSYQICLDVAEKGGGIALGWARTVQSRLDGGRLVRIPGMTMQLPDAVNVYWPKNATLSPLAASFIELIERRMDAVR